MGLLLLLSLDRGPTLIATAGDTTTRLRKHESKRRLSNFASHALATSHCSFRDALRVERRLLSGEMDVALAHRLDPAEARVPTAV